MREYAYAIAGDPVRILVPETQDDLRQFFDWFQRANRRGPIALDTETSGLAVYSPGYRLRTVQFGDSRTAWVIHWERGGHFREAAAWALRVGTKFLIHNAPFDWAVLDRHAATPIEDLAPRTADTRLKAGLVDPRQPQEGGRGTALKPLSAYYLDPSAPDTQGDLTAVFRSLKLTKATGWAGIPLDHPTYNLYAGLDVILTARLDVALSAELVGLGVRPALVAYEHELARICALMQRRGIVLDIPYTQSLSRAFSAEEERFAGVALAYGVENFNSRNQLIAAFLGMGEEWIGDEITQGEPFFDVDSGEWAMPEPKRKVDKNYLCRLADVDKFSGVRLGARTPNPLAEAIIAAKRAGKWRTAYADTFLDVVDAEGRVHPFIGSMQARTARMSITRPALQTLPSRDWRIRRCLLAEDGHVWGSTDFSAVEMRVLAAIAGVKKMIKGFRQGEDIHMYTAKLIKGEAATAADRKVFKGAGFGKVYGGGAATLARQTGAPIEDIRRAIAAYDREYPEIRRLSNRWQREALETGLVHVSITGRRLPLDRDRMYAVVNYGVQSAARDCLGQALIDMDAKGLTPYLRLPIHDEVVYSVPRGPEGVEVANAITECMNFDLRGVPITAEPDLGGRSWGSLYTKGAERDSDPMMAIAA